MKIKDEKLLEYVKENGGITIDTKKKILKYKTGYQVSVKDCYIIPVDDDKLFIDTINKTIQQAQKGENVGAWKNDGQYYIDISENIKNRKKAIEKGRQLNQISIFDCKNLDCIYLKKQNS